MKTKTAIKILIIITILSLGILSYFIFFKKDASESGEVVLPNQPSSNFFPNSEPFEPNSENKNEDDDTTRDRFTTISKLRQISDNPVAGFTIFDERATSSDIIVSEGDEDVLGEDYETVYRFVNRSNGNIFETTSRTSSLKRITNNTIPKVQESIFSEDSNSLVFRYLDNSNSIETYFSKITMNENSETIGEGDFAELESVFLQKNISNINFSEDGLVFYTTNSNNSEGYIFDINSPDNQNFSFSSDLRDIRTEWFKENSILIGTKPSNNSGGLLFEYNFDDQSTKKILDGGNGFNFKSNNNLIVYSELSGSEIKSYSYNTETKEFVDLELNTIISDKCEWSNISDTIIYCAVPNSKIGFGYPNLWHQGQVSFNDKLFKIDTETGLKIEISGLLDNDFDITKIQVSDNDEYIVFVNKKDLTLWSLDIK